jgi:g-D-glutamyl-meso-diaminopimelate peptidase
MAVEAQVPLCGLPMPQALEGRQVWFVPLVNPDGVNIARYGSRAAGPYWALAADTGANTPGLWQANARGVDIRYNFDFRFTNRKKQQESKGIYSPCGEGYCGPSPESEPETIAITSFCRNHRISQAVCLYPGNGSVYWRSVGCDCEIAEKQANVMGVVSGYEVEASVGCAIDSGFRNWFCASFHKPAFDIMVYPTKDSAHKARVYELLTLSCLF